MTPAPELNTGDIAPAETTSEAYKSYMVHTFIHSFLKEAGAYQRKAILNLNQLTSYILIHALCH